MLGCLGDACPHRALGTCSSPSQPGSSGSLGAEPQAPLTEPSLEAGQLGQLSKAAAARATGSSCASPCTGASPGQSSQYPQEGLLRVSQGQTQPRSAGGTGWAPAAGPSDEEGGDGPSGAARHLPRPPPPALDASAFAGCCRPSLRGDDERRVPPGTPWLFPATARGAADDGFPSWAPLLSAQLAGVIWAVGPA